MAIKKIIYIWVILFFALFNGASASFISETAKQDTLLCHAIENIAKTPEKSSDIIKYYYNNLSDCENQAEIIYNYARVSYLMGRMDTVRNVIERHIDKVTLIRERRFYGRTLHLYSILHKLNSQYSESLKFQFKALDIAEECKDTLLQLTCRNSISGIHFALGEYDKARVSLSAAISILDSAANPKKYHDMSSNLATIYAHLNQYSKALGLLELSEKWYIENDYKSSLPAVYNLMHGIFVKKQDYKRALYYAKKMLEVNNFENKYSTTATYATLASSLSNYGDFDQAHTYFSKAIYLAKKHNYTSLLLFNYKCLYESFEKYGNVDSAFVYLKLLRELEESSDKKSVSKAFEVYEVNNKLHEKDSAIAKIESNYYSSTNILKTITLAFGFSAVIAFVFNHRKQKKLLALLAEKEKIEATLKEAEKIFTANKSNQDLDSKLAQCIYREFREQIQGIMFSSDVLENEIKKTSFSKNYSAPIKILNQTSGLLRNFLDYMILYNDLNNGEIKIQTDRTNISEITERCLRILKSKISDKKLTVIHRHNFYTTNTDRNLVEFIIMCLLSNATKYSTPKTTVEIKYELMHGTLFLTVSDSGLGIDSNAINIESPDRIRSRPGTHGEKGTGMSLIIAHKMAKILGANITYQNNADRGASFTLVLPNTVEVV